MQAVHWFRKAAEQGGAAAQHNLGIMYEEGEGVEKDAVQAAHWLRKAAEQGFAVAQYSLGIMYEKGEGVTEDAVQGVTEGDRVRGCSSTVSPWQHVMQRQWRSAEFKRSSEVVANGGGSRRC